MVKAISPFRLAIRAMTCIDRTCARDGQKALEQVGSRRLNAIGQMKRMGWGEDSTPGRFDA